ncbi:MAG: hypothetical protein AAGG48_17655 [Planctomycetota bacterium]
MIELVVTAQGNVRGIYDDRVDLRSIGHYEIRRGSHVEPTDAGGRWIADMTPVDGPVLGPFPKRGEALAAEVAWLQQNWLVTTTD